MSLNTEQLNALLVYAREHKRNWKADLRQAWMTGNYEPCDNAALLQQIRNAYGPSWLVRFRASQHTSPKPQREALPNTTADASLIIIGHNKDGELRYAQTATAPGVRAAGITPDKAKATTYTDLNEANGVLQILNHSHTWRGYRWRVRDAIVRPCD